jgi:hypothetical protein
MDTLLIEAANLSVLNSKSFTQTDIAFMDLGKTAF